MNRSLAVLGVAVTLSLIAGSTPAFGAQLATYLDPGNTSSEFEIKYPVTVFIDYEDGGDIANLMRGQSHEITISAGAENPGVQDLISKFNDKILRDGSGVKITDLRLDYTARLAGNQDRTAIDFNIKMHGTITDYIIVEGKGAQQALIDVGWRGLSITGPVIVDGIDINSPFAGISEMAPRLSSAMAGSEAEALLSTNIIKADDILELPLSNWHFLFDPTGIGVDASQFGLNPDIAGVVISAFTMGESSIREGRQVEIEEDASFSADREYGVRLVKSQDIANIKVVGFAAIDTLDGLDILGVSPKPPEGFGTTSTGEFPIMIVYGMAGLAAVGGGVFFVFSNRQLKKEAGQGQTGIDPSRLTGYQTSASSGGYQTNRGEAQLTESSEYAQHRSVYDGESAGSAPQLPPQDEAACGCAASLEMGSECDCVMQGSCLCDASCRCQGDVCRQHVESMS